MAKKAQSGKISDILIGKGMITADALAAAVADAAAEAGAVDDAEGPPAWSQPIANAAATRATNTDVDPRVDVQLMAAVIPCRECAAKPAVAKSFSTAACGSGGGGWPTRGRRPQGPRVRSESRPGAFVAGARRAPPADCAPQRALRPPASPRSMWALLPALGAS